VNEMNEERDFDRKTPENLTIPAESSQESELAEAPEVELPDEELLYELADLFKIFGDTTRIKILYALMNRPLNVGDLAELVGSSQSAVSHQLRTLKAARLVKFRRDGKNALYSLADDHVHTVLAQGMTHICE
jgi:DNA-binding transcriptional ArsR family regulator